MIRWLHRVLPPPWVLVLAGFIFVFFQAFFLYLEWRFHIPFFSREGAEWNDAHKYLGASMGFLGALYGIYRALVFHPAVRLGYYDWLRTTPWTSQKPLPLGPIHLVWQDVVILAVAVGLNWPRLQVQSVWLVESFAVSYLLALGFMHYSTGEKIWGLAIGFGVGGVVLCSFNLLIFASSAAIVYGLALLGLRQSLARFPWEESASFNRKLLAMRKMNAGNYKWAIYGTTYLGWPYDWLAPRFSDIQELGDYSSRDRIIDSACFGLLVGWWIFVWITLIPAKMILGPGREDPAVGFAAFLLFIVFIGALLRIFIFCNGYISPVNLLGRIVHGRWIIPGYDKVFVAPLLALLVAVTAFCLCLQGLPPWAIIPIAYALVILILLGMGPDLKVWRLTGNHRMVRGPGKNLVQAG